VAASYYKDIFKEMVIIVCLTAAETQNTKMRKKYA
jgi:hypothetical protein